MVCHAGRRPPIARLPGQNKEKGSGVASWTGVRPADLHLLDLLGLLVLATALVLVLLGDLGGLEVGELLLHLDHGGLGGGGGQVG